MNRLLLIGCGVILSSCAFGETNYVEEMNKLSRNERTEYILSLSEAEVLSLANDAYKSGWDNYAVNAGILAKYYGAKAIEFTTAKKISIIRDPKMEPAFRANVGFQGLRVDSFSNLTEFLNYVDECLCFLEEPTVGYFWKQGVPEWLREAFQGKMDKIKKQPMAYGNTAEALDKLDARGMRVMNDLVACLEANSRPSEDRKGYSASSFAVASLSKYVAWNLDDEAFLNRNKVKRLDAVRKAQKALVLILEDSEYDQAAAHMVLRHAAESKLEQVLDHTAVPRFRKDERFSDGECPQFLDRLEGRTSQRQTDKQEKISEKISGSDLNNKL